MSITTYWLPLPMHALAQFAIERTSVMVHADLWHKVATKHPESLSVVELHLDATITTPDYIGQAPQHFENIEFIKRTPGGPLLVAIKIKNKRGFCIRPIVASAYVIELAKLANRLNNRTVRRLK